MFDVQCKGTETELSECSYKDYDQCRYYDMASVICTKCKLLWGFQIYSESTI